ncbi:MAG: hypothetical protein ACLFR9_08680, partial [Desulfobacterales bacterium]
LLLGFILHWLYYLTGWLQQENVIFWQGEISKTPGVLAARLIFSLLVVAALVRGLGRMSDSFVHRFLFKLPVQTGAAPGPEK